MRILLRNILKGVGVSIVFAVVSYLSLIIGSILGAQSNLSILGYVLVIPGVLFILPALPFVFLIDHLPMYYLFSTGGASGIFGSMFVFAICIWSIIFSFLSKYKKWLSRTPQAAPLSSNVMRLGLNNE